jgi:hypothetical protein
LGADFRVDDLAVTLAEDVMWVRVCERLTATVECRGATGAATTTGRGLGLGLTTPVKPMSPKVRGSRGAWAAEGAATATARATGAVVAMVVGAA